MVEIVMTLEDALEIELVGDALKSLQTLSALKKYIIEKRQSL